MGVSRTKDTGAQFNCRCQVFIFTFISLSVKEIGVGWFGRHLFPIAMGDRELEVVDEINVLKITESTPTSRHELKVRYRLCLCGKGTGREPEGSLKGRWLIQTDGAGSHIIIQIRFVSNFFYVFPEINFKM